MTSDFGVRASRAAILRASSNGQAFERSASSRRSATGTSADDIGRAPEARPLEHFSGLPVDAAPSKRADREIAQPKVAEAAQLPDPEQCPVQGEPDRVIALLDSNADPFAEIAAVEIGAAPEGAAISRISAVEPERQRHRVTEQEIDVALAQREASDLGARIGAHLDLSEELLKIGLVRGAGHDRNFLAFELFGQGVLYRRIAARHEAARRAVIGIGEIGLRAGIGGDRDRGNDGVAAVFVE